MTEEKGT